MALEFYDRTHRYEVDGRPLLSVTYVLREAGLIPDWASEEDMTRGRAVHQACHYLDEGTLAWTTVDARIVPYVRAWEKFKAEKNITFTPSDIEVRLSSVRLGVAGRLDRRGLLDGCPTKFDIKTGRVECFTALQLAAYDALSQRGADDLYADWKYAPSQRLAVALRVDGNYSLRPFPVQEARRDFRAFCGALEFVRWKIQVGWKSS